MPSLALTSLRRRPAAVLAAVLLTVGLIGAPFLASGYILRFLTEVFMAMTLAQAWNVLGGLSGYVSFGIVAFFGMGAYVTGILMLRADVPLLAAVVLATLTAVVLALVIGFPLLRLRGHYFAIATLGVAEAMRQIAATATPLTGGGMGLSLPLPMGSIAEQSTTFYFLMLGVLVSTVAATALILRSRLGFGLRAIRANEDAAAMLGVDTTRYKIVAFAISAVFPALAGGIYAGWQTYIDPATVFQVDMSVQAVVLTLLGGIGSLWGPVVGGALLLTVSELLWGNFLELHTAFLGIVLIVVVVFMPMGILGVRRSRTYGTTPESFQFNLSALRRSMRRYSV